MVKISKKHFSKCIIKATSRSSNPPKEKYIRVIINTVQSGNHALIDDIIRELCRRLENKNWKSVLKTLMIFHRCFSEGDKYFMESLKDRSTSIFTLKIFRDANPQVHIYTAFILRYAKYLEEQVSVVRLLGFQFENKRECCKNLTLPYAFKIVPKLQSQVNALLNCKMRQTDIGKGGVVLSAFLLLLKDSFILYPILNDGVINLIDSCFSMKKNEVEKVLNIYKLFIRETDALISLYSNLRAFVPHIPTIRRAKTSLIDVLQNHIEKMDYTNYEPSSLTYTEGVIENPFSSASISNVHYSEYISSEESSSSVEESVSSSFDESASSSSSSEDITVSRIGSDVQFSPENYIKDSWFSTEQQEKYNTAQGWDIFENNSISESPSFTSTTFSDKFYTDPFNNSLESIDSFNYDKQGSSSQVTSPEVKQYRERANSVKSLINQLYISQSQSQISENPFLDPKFNSDNKSVNPFIETGIYNMELQEKKNFNPFL